MSRLLDVLRLVTDNASTPTHPAGCMAIVSAEIPAANVKWAVLVNDCDRIHPKTQRGLSQQYRNQGWEAL